MTSTITYAQALQQLHTLFPTIDIDHLHGILQSTNKNLVKSYNKCVHIVESHNSHIRSYIDPDELQQLKARQSTLRHNIIQSNTNGIFSLKSKQLQLIPRLQSVNRIKRGAQQRVATIQEVAAVSN